jgi:hypothetical protein
MTRGGRYGQGPPEFGLVVSWQPVTRGVVLEPPPPEPGLGELPEQRTQQQVPVLGEPDQRPRVQRSRIGQRNRADPGARGQRDVGGQQRKASAVGPDVADQVVKAEVDGAIFDGDAEVVGEAPQEIQLAQGGGAPQDALPQVGPGGARARPR